MGIPFAEPPVGSLRWSSPRSPAPWRHTLNATQFGLTCYNMVQGYPAGHQGEDCLTVNVWTGATKMTEKRPVMVWIYGGGFQFGSSSLPTYSGATLAEKGMVVVSFNYRMGVFGFLALTELDREGTSSGDFGLQDQLAALQWIQENIWKLGGDPDNITLFGQSAGAHSIGLLMCSSFSKGLFHRGILESGAYWDGNHGDLCPYGDARQTGLTFQKRLGAKTVADLRALPAITIMSNTTVDEFSPSIDDYIIPAAPAQVFTNGQQLQIPLLGGWNHDEQYLFLSVAPPHQNASVFRSALKTMFGSRTPEALSLYPASTNAKATISADTLAGDLIIREQVWEALDSQSQNPNLNVYAYYFTYTSAYSPIAIHTAELPFVFGTLTPNAYFSNASAAGPQDRLLSDRLMTYWTNFAKTGNPNTPLNPPYAYSIANKTTTINVTTTQLDLPYFPRYTGEGAFDILELGNNIKPIEYNLSRFEFIKSLRYDGILPLGWRSAVQNSAGVEGGMSK